MGYGRVVAIMFLLSLLITGDTMPNHYTDAITQPVQQGMTNILDIIFELESSSGANKKAYTPNNVGALGGYQLRPDAFKDIQRVFPEKWAKKSFKTVAKNDLIARKAASDYVNVIQMHLSNNNIAPTMDALLAGYHSGMGNVVKGNIGKEGLNYLKKASVLRGT